MSRTRVFTLLATTLFAVAGCSPMALPGVQMDPQAPSGPEPQPYAGAMDQQVVVQYYVNCRGCTIEYSTPDGPRVLEDVQGGMERRVVFAQDFIGSAVILNATPPNDTRIVRATITVNGRRVATTSDPAAAGVPVYLNTVLPRAGTRGGV